MRLVVSFILVVAFSGTASSQVIFQIPNLLDPRQNGTLQPQPQPLSEGRKRQLVLPSIRNLTACVIDYVNSEDEALLAYRENRFSPYVRSLVARCATQVADLSARYDRVYGPGSADEFIQGNYSNDLPRAVLARTKDKLQARLDDYDRAQARARAARQAEEARARVERQAEEEHQAALGRQRADDDRAAAAKAETERKAAEADRAATEAKAAQQKREQLDVANRSFSVLRDKMYTCVDAQLPQIVKSGESAEVLASAALTICNRTLVEAEDAGLDAQAIENGTRPSGIAEEAFREKAKSVVRERAVADAVMAKAGVGQFAPK